MRTGDTKRGCRVRSFAPVSGAGARVLVLGSMPGAASLAAGEYYAHPRNSFWPLMLDIFGARGPLPYAGRLALLRRNGVALWDVLASCVRPGSSDAAIRRATAEANDIGGFLLAHPRISLVCFNGAKAEECYRRHVLPFLPPAPAGLRRRLLPSTSPAHASLSYAAKLRAWRRALLEGE